MSDYGYFEMEPSYNATTIDDDFIGGTSIIIIGIISLIIVAFIILSIHLFAKKINNLQFESGYQQFDDSAGEIEPLPEYEEREEQNQEEVDISEYINTIPRDTMNIINILSSNSLRSIYSDNRIQFNNNNDISDNNNNGNHRNNQNNSNNDCNSNCNDSNRGDNQINNDMNVDEQLLAIPSTSTLPLPKPGKENKPCVPPPCYDIALTQPRINDQGMIVLPQDPSFTTNLPSLQKSSKIHHHYLRRTRKRVMRFFSSHDNSSSSNNNNNLQNHSLSVNSNFSDSSSSSLICNNNNNNDRNNNNNNSDNNSNNNNNNNSNISGNGNGNNNNNNNSISIINRRSSSRRSRSRSFINRFRITHSSSPSSWKDRRNALPLNNHLSDNDSISSVSIYPTTMIDIPEDHYNINGNICREIRNNHIPEIERGCTSTATVIPGMNDNSDIVHALPEEDVVNSTFSNIDTNITDIQSQQTNSIEVLNSVESLVEASHCHPPLILHEREIINFNSINNTSNNKNKDKNKNSDNDNDNNINK